MIFFLYGPDTYRSRQKLKELKDKFFKEVDSSSLNLSFLDGAKMKIEEFNSAIATPPFLSRKRMIVVSDLLSRKADADFNKLMLELLEKENLLKDVILIFIESVEPDKRTVLFKRLSAEKYAQEFGFLTDLEMKNWLRLEVKNRGGKISPPAIDKFVFLVGSDLWTASSEIDKLVSYKAGGVIEPGDVEEMVKGKFDENIFNFVDAIANKNKKLAHKLLTDQLASGANELYLLTMLIRQFRILLLVKDLTGGEGGKKQSVAREMGIHPFVAQKALAQIRNFSDKKLREIYQKLLETDLKIKTSWADSRVLFDLLLVEIMK